MQIFLNDLRFYAHHGVTPQEQKVGGWYTVSLQLSCLNEQATESDRLDQTVDYSQVFNAVRDEMQHPSSLIEHVCGRICNRLLRDFRLIDSITVTVTKQNPPMGADCAGCGVQLTRSRTAH